MKVRRFLALGLITLAAGGLAEAAGHFGGLTGVRDLENKTLDWRELTTAESLVPGAGKRTSDVVLVLFDKFSVMDSTDGWPYLSPFPRRNLAELINAVSAAGAKAIGLDVYLDRLYPRLNSWDGGDDSLHDAIEKAGNVILVAPVTQTDSGPVLAPPHPYFADVAAGVGAADLPTAFETVRDATLAVRSGDGLKPSFALELYAKAKGLDVDSLLRAARRTGRLSLPGLPSDEGRIPADWWKKGTSAADNVLPFTLRFIGPPSTTQADRPPGAFQAFPSSTVPTTASLFPDFFKGKIVLMGTGFHDSDKFRTPFFNHPVGPDSTETWGYTFGVEIHANALQDMLDRQYVHRARDVFLLLLVMALITGGVAFWKGAGWGGAATVLAVLGVTAAAFWLWAGQIYGPWGSGVTLPFVRRFLWLPIVTPALAAVLGYVGSVAYVSVVEGKEKRFIKGAFGKYVSPEVVEEIAERPEALQLGGQKRPLTLLFSDLAGFTTLSERMDPQDLLAHLNEYLSEMTQIVLHERGTLDKYIGDAIMAFWNAPKEIDDHAERALRTAVLMQRKMAELNARWRAKDPDSEPLVVRIGINTGTVVVGNVGGAERFDYSAIGDAVNLAARLEPANKTYGTLIMVSELTLDAADRTQFRVRELDLVAVKGKKEPVKVYELIELAGAELAPHREEALDHYAGGWKAYRNRDWELAAQYFRAALEADPEDGPSAVYLERSAEYVTSPPPADWDFVVRRTVK